MHAHLKGYSAEGAFVLSGGKPASPTTVLTRMFRCGACDRPWHTRLHCLLAGNGGVGGEGGEGGVHESSIMNL